MLNSPKNFYKKLLGRQGEQLVSKFLKKQGYKILENNYEIKGYGEIDVIACKGKEICFVEVKTRTSVKFGEPCEAVNVKKQEKYYSISQKYIERNNYEDYTINFVVAEVIKDKINLINNAF